MSSSLSFLFSSSRFAISTCRPGITYMTRVPPWRCLHTWKSRSVLWQLSAQFWGVQIRFGCNHLKKSYFWSSISTYANPYFCEIHTSVTLTSRYWWSTDKFWLKLYEWWATSDSESINRFIIVFKIHDSSSSIHTFPTSWNWNSMSNRLQYQWLFNFTWLWREVILNTLTLWFLHLPLSLQWKPFLIRPSHWKKTCTTQFQFQVRLG